MKEGMYRSYFSTIAKDMIFTGRLHKKDDKIEKSPYNLLKFADYCYCDVSYSTDNLSIQYKKERKTLTYDTLKRATFYPLASPSSMGEGSFTLLISLDSLDGDNIMFHTGDINECNSFYSILSRYAIELIDKENLHVLWKEDMDIRASREILNKRIEDHRSDYYLLSDEKKHFNKF